MSMPTTVEHGLWEDGLKPWADLLSWARSPWLYVGGAVFAFALAVVGYDTYLKDGEIWDVLFHALNLLALNFRLVEGVAVPGTLQVARILVHVVAAGALLVTATALARRRADRWRAFAWSEHVVLLGSTPTAVELALAYRATTGKVVLVGAVAEEQQDRLRRAGVRVVAASDEGSLGGIVEGAKRVIVAGDGDHDTVQLVTRLLATSGEQDRPTHLLVEQPELASELRASLPGGVDVCCVAERVASAVLQSYPPRDEETLGPGPVVIGRSELAVELVRRMVRGWYRPADPMRVLCLGPEPNEFVELAEEVASAGRIEVAPEPWGTPRQVLEQVVAHAAAHRPSDRDLQRRSKHGPLVVLAGLDDAETFTLAVKISGKVAGARVVALVDRADGWIGIAAGSTLAQGATLEVVSARSIVREPTVLETDRTRLLAHELFADQRRWRDDVPSIFGDDVRAVAGFDALDASQRKRFETVAKAVPAAFRAAGLQIESTHLSQLMLLPEELLEISAQLRRAAGHGAGVEYDEYLWLEFVAQLPMLAARAGIDVVRSVPREVAIGDKELEAMARAVHETYVNAQNASGNLTGSQLAEQEWGQLTEFAKESNRAQVRDIPVKLAGVGRTLCRLGRDGPQRSWLTEEVVHRLAIWEHRRWEYLHRLAGYTYAETTDHATRQHSMLVSWEELDEAETLDASAVHSIPDLLAGVGLDTRPIDR